jgi:hypothetical protein
MSTVSITKTETLFRGKIVAVDKSRRTVRMGLHDGGEQEFTVNSHTVGFLNDCAQAMMEETKVFVLSKNGKWVDQVFREVLFSSGETIYDE